MFDIKLVKQADTSYDFGIEDGDFVIDDGLETSTIVSVLSDRRADASQVPDAEFRRGWIGDLVTTVPGYEIGSHIWLLESSRLTQTVLNIAKDYAEKSLDWMIPELASKIEAQSSIVEQQGQNDSILIQVSITSPSGSITNQAFVLWKTTLANIS